MSVTHGIDLTVALRHANNQPQQLLHALMECTGVQMTLCDLNSKGFGIVPDFRVDGEVNTLHIEENSAGTIVYQCEGERGFLGDAVTLVAAVLNLSLEHSRQWLIDRIQTPQSYPQRVEISSVTAYGVQNGQICLYTSQANRRTGEVEVRTTVLTNFSAYIVEMATFTTGMEGNEKRRYTIAGFARDGQPLSPPTISVDSAEFTAMQWPAEHWALQATVLAGPNVRDHARVAIQVLSGKQPIKQRVIHTRIGWMKHAKYGWIYITASAVIGKDGAVASMDVQLPDSRMRQYALPPVPEQSTLQEATRSSLHLLDAIPERYSIPYLAAVYRGPLGHLDAMIWPTGKTGLQKTALLSIMMLHYGPDWNERSWPMSWNSTVNAIELYGSSICDVLVPIEDYKKVTADPGLSRILQAVGDGVSRHRLSRESTLRPAPPLCGVFCSTSETYPTGHSDTARTIIVSVTEKIAADDVTSRAMRAAQQAGGAGIYSTAMAGFIQFIAARHERVYGKGSHHVTHVRQYETFFNGAHARTGGSIADLSYGCRLFLHHAVSIEAITADDAQQYWIRVCRVLRELAAAQGSDQAEEDPIPQALRLLDVLFLQGRVHVIPVQNLDQESAAVGTLTHNIIARHDHIAAFAGWSSTRRDGDWIYLLPDAVYEVLHDAARRQNVTLPKKTTLWARLRDELHPLGLMLCDREGPRLRSTHSMLVNGERHRCISLRWPLSKILTQLGTEKATTDQLPDLPAINWHDDI